MSRKTLFIAVILLIFGLCVASNSVAAIYKYVDKDGMLYFADDLQAVPAQYRATATIVSGEAKEEATRPVDQSLQEARTEKRESDSATGSGQGKSLLELGDKRSFGSRALTSAIVIVTALFTFIILGILDTDHKKAVKIVRIVVAWGVSVFLIYAHAGDVVHVFTAAGKHIENVQDASEEKGKKAAKAIKALDKLTENAEKASSNDSGGTAPEK
jgi:hypothetical protein